MSSSQGEAVINMDFSENASLAVGREVHNNYWNSASATLFINAISWRWAPDVEEPIKTNRIFISKDKNHSHRCAASRCRCSYWLLLLLPGLAATAATAVFSAHTLISARLPCQCCCRFVKYCLNDITS